MFATKITLKNFRSHANTTLNLARRTYLVGHNNAGKSSVFDALGWAITGRCRGLDGLNREIEELIRENQKRGLGVRVELAEFGSVERQTDGRQVFLKMKDWTGSNKQQQDEFYRLTRTTEALWLACLDSSIFLNLHHAEAKALTMGVLNVRIPADKLEPLGIAGPLSVEELDGHYRAVFARRTDAKNLLEGHAIYPEPEDPDEPPAVEDLEASVATLREEERTMIEAAGKGRGRHAELTRQLADQREDLARVEARIRGYGDPNTEIDEVEAEIAKLPAPPEPTAATPGNLFGKAEDSPAKKQSDAIGRKLIDERGRLRLLEDSVAGIAGHKPDKGCVIDGSIPCLTPAKEFSGKLADVRKSIKEIKATVETLTAEAKSIDDQVAAERKAATDALTAERRMNEHRRELERRRSAATAKLASKQTDEERGLELTGQILDTEKALATLGEVDEDTTDLVALQQRIARGAGIVKAAQAWHFAKGQHDQSVARAESLREEVATLEKRCDALGPKGLIVEALEQARARFEDQVNAALAPFGYSLAFQFDPWTVRVNGRKSTQLSESERLRVGVALQLAIATIAGFGLACIDRVDMLDARNREALGDVVAAFDGQLLMASTKDTNAPEFEAPPMDDDEAFYAFALDDERTTEVLGLTADASPA